VPAGAPRDDRSQLVLDPVRPDRGGRNGRDDAVDGPSRIRYPVDEEHARGHVNGVNPRGDSVLVQRCGQPTGESAVRLAMGNDEVRLAVS